MFGHACDQSHVVIDDEDGQPLGRDAVEQIVKNPFLAGIEARGRLVEQQHGRIGRQSAGKFDQALVPIAEARDRLARARSEPDKIECGLGAPPQRRGACGDERVAFAFGADDDIFERSHRAEQPDVLEGAREAEGGALVRRQAGHFDAVDENRARIGAVEPGDDIERRCLAAPVGADQRMHAAAAHLKIDAVDRLQAAKILDETAHLERGRSAGIGGAQQERLGGCRRRARRARDEPSEEAPDALGHENDDQNDRGAVDREIEAGHALQKAQPFRNGIRSPVPIAEPIGEATPPSSAIVNSTIESEKAN